MSTAPTQHHLEANGGRLYYEVRGSGPLLLVVGQPMTSGPFGALADDLAGDHTVVTYDPHGVGESSVDDPSLSITPEIEADDLVAIVDELGLGPAAVLGTSGGAVAGLAFASRHPDKITTLIVHEPPVADLLPDAAPIRAAVDAIEDTYRTAGSGAAWGAFASLVMHDGPVPADGVPPAAWPPPGTPTDDQPGDPTDVEPGDPAQPEPSAKQQADDALFFLRMLEPFTRYAPDVTALRDGPMRVRVAVGEASGAELARRSADALADELGQTAVVFASHHAGFMEDPAGFATSVRKVLAAP